MIPAWSIGRPSPRAGHPGLLLVLDQEDGPLGRTVCVVPGHLEWQITPQTVVRLLDEQDVENARLIAMAPQLRAVLAALVAWSERTGGWGAPCWPGCGTRTPRLDVLATAAGPVRVAGGIHPNPDEDYDDRAHHAGAARTAARQRRCAQTDANHDPHPVVEAVHAACRLLVAVDPHRA